MNRLLACLLLGWSLTCFAPDFTLLGLIKCNAAAGHSVAVFENADGDSLTRYVSGLLWDGWKINSIEENGVWIDKDAKFDFIPLGGIGINVDPILEIHQQTDNYSEITIPEDTRSYIAGEGLLKILWQAGTEYVEDTGYRLFAIEPGSIFELIGLQNQDIIEEIDDTRITNPLIALQVLNRIRNYDSVDYKVIRGGTEYSRKIKIQ